MPYSQLSLSSLSINNLRWRLTLVFLLSTLKSNSWKSREWKRCLLACKCYCQKKNKKILDYVSGLLKCLKLYEFMDTLSLCHARLMGKKSNNKFELINYEIEEEKNIIFRFAAYLNRINSQQSKQHKSVLTLYLWSSLRNLTYNVVIMNEKATTKLSIFWSKQHLRERLLTVRLTMFFQWSFIHSVVWLLDF